MSQDFYAKNATIKILDKANWKINDTVDLENTEIRGAQQGIFNLRASNISLKQSVIYADLKLSAKNLLIDKDSEINANNLGYLADQGPGRGEDGTGAGYGGKGGDCCYKKGGKAYGTSTNPVSFGSGGGSSLNKENNYKNLGGRGGGTIYLEIENLFQLQGTISVNGEEGKPFIGGVCQASGAGSGGSILIQTNIFEGNGQILANGGDVQQGGSGGGGRIKLDIQNNQFGGQVKADSGQCQNKSHCGETGSIVVVISQPLN